VLLVDGEDVPDDGGHDVLVSGPALRGLRSLDLPGLDPWRPVEEVDIRFGADVRHIVGGAGAAVCDRDRFRTVLRGAATGFGAVETRGTVTSLTRVDGGHRARIEVAGDVTSVVARHVVLAVGAGGGGGLVPPGLPHTYGVVCVQRFTGAGSDARMTMALPAPSATGTGAPACVWALPGEDGAVTIGTASVSDGSPAPAEQLRAALSTLADADPRFAAVRPAGPPLTGPLSTGYAPKRVADAGVLLVGEAAGLVNPFTGEGFSYAVQSGLLAARAIAACRSNPAAVHRRYVRRLATIFVGYFETARYAGRRYHLAWRILAAGAESDHPFFAKSRRAILLPEGFSGLTAVERMDFAKPDAALFGPFLAACDEVAISAVRREWPFLARLAVAGESVGRHGLRPAIPFFAALLAEGTRPPIDRAPLGAAIELALLSTLALLGPAQSTAPARGIDWALTSTILAGDFLLAQASRLVAEYAPEVSWSFADWLGELAALRAARLDPRQHSPAAAVYASLLEFPVRIGAQLGGGTPGTVRALREFGRQCGQVFLCAEDVLALRGERTRLDTTLPVMLEGRFSGIPEYLDGGPVSAGLLAADPRSRSRALATATATGEAALRRALRTLVDLPEPTAVRILTDFAETAAAPLRAPSISTVSEHLVARPYCS